MQVATGLTSPTYTVTSPGNGLYLVKALSAAFVESVTAASFNIAESTSGLNGVGSVPPGQTLLVNVPVLSYDSGSGLCTCEIECPAQSLLRPDGTTYSVPDSTLTWTKLLTPATTYYIYTTIRLTDGTIHSAAGDPPTLPDTSPNPTHALQAAADGYLVGPILTITTPNTTGGSGSSSGGGKGVCPDADEKVITARGILRVGDVIPGDEILGHCFKQNAPIYRRVVAIKQLPAWSWYRVKGYRMSPMDPVWVNEEWVTPWSVGEFDGGPGTRARIEVEADCYDQHNYYLVGRGEPLMIHNFQLPAC